MDLGKFDYFRCRSWIRARFLMARTAAKYTIPDPKYAAWSKLGIRNARKPGNDMELRNFNQIPILKIRPKQLEGGRLTGFPGG